MVKSEVNDNHTVFFARRHRFRTDPVALFKSRSRPVKPRVRLDIEFPGFRLISRGEGDGKRLIGADRAREALGFHDPSVPVVPGVPVVFYSHTFCHLSSYPRLKLKDDK